MSGAKMAASRKHMTVNMLPQKAFQSLEKTLLQYPSNLATISKKTKTTIKAQQFQGAIQPKSGFPYEITISAAKPSIYYLQVL